MKTFQQFILEAYDPEVQGRSQIRKQGEGGRVGTQRKKSEPEKRRTKAVGGGKLHLLNHTKHVRILVLNAKDLNVSNNQLKKEGLLGYQRRKHKKRHI